MRNYMKTNLGSIANPVRPTLSIGDKKPVWFIREKIVGWYEQSIVEWKEWCDVDGIEPIDEVWREVNKLLDALKTEANITKKTVDWKIVMGYSPDLDKLALDWLDLYLDFEVKK